MCLPFFASTCTVFLCHTCLCQLHVLTVRRFACAVFRLYVCSLDGSHYFKRMSRALSVCPPPRTFGSKGTDNLIQTNRIRRTIGSDESRRERILSSGSWKNVYHNENTDVSNCEAKSNFQGRKVALTEVKPTSLLPLTKFAPTT